MKKKEGFVIKLSFEKLLALFNHLYDLPEESRLIDIWTDRERDVIKIKFHSEGKPIETENAIWPNGVVEAQEWPEREGKVKARYRDIFKR